LVRDSHLGVEHKVHTDDRLYIKKNHILTHQILKINFYIRYLQKGWEEKQDYNRGKSYFSFDKANDLPKPIVIKSVLDSLIKQYV
jgi:hypothetical protein